VIRDLKSGIVDDESTPSVMYLPLTRRDFCEPAARRVRSWFVRMREMRR